MATGTTTPRKRTAAAKSTAAKATPAKAAPKAADTPAITSENGQTKVTFELSFVAETKNYAKFEVPVGNGCVGAIYAPIGTETVKVLLIGPADSAE